MKYPISFFRDTWNHTVICIMAVGFNRYDRYDHLFEKRTRTRTNLHWHKYLKDYDRSIPRNLPMKILSSTPELPGVSYFA